MLFPNTKTSTTVWDMEDDRSVGVLEGHTSTIFSAQINNNGSMAVTIPCEPVVHDDELRAVKVWNLGTMQCTASLISSRLLASTLLQDRLLLGSYDGTIKVWDIGGSTPVALMDLEGHTGFITASDTSNIVLSGSHDKSMRLWDLRTGQCVRVMEGHNDAVRSVSMDSACRNIVSGSDDKTAKLWDLGSGRCIQTYKFDGYAHSVMMHESGGSFLVASGDVFFSAFFTAPGYTDSTIIRDVDLSSMCDSMSVNLPSVAASRDLSRVGLCCLKPREDSLAVSVWK